jgi:DNA-binding transcriptional ArsR family regulator
MDETTAVEAFAALGQPARLAAFRLLVRAGPEGLPAGEIAKALGAPANTVSGHLAILARAGLIAGERHGRLIRYRLDSMGVRVLLVYLLEDCCQGRPDLCAPRMVCA